MLREFLRKRRAAARAVIDDRRDMLLADVVGREDYWRMLQSECEESSLIALLEKALVHPGDVIECGVYRGASLRRIARTAKDIAPERTVFGLDSFEGFPDGGISEQDTRQFRGETRLMGKFKDANDVPARLNRMAEVFDIRLELRRGYFENTLPTVSSQEFCFLHIDCDTYAGHKEVLESLYDQLVPGAVIVFDDYDAKSWPGATKAVDEFLGKKGLTIERCEARASPAWFCKKPAG